MFNKTFAVYFFALSGAANLLFAQTAGTGEREETRLSILKELEGEVPVWAGRYSATSIDTVTEYCLAPEAGAALALDYGDKITTLQTGKVVGYSCGRIMLRWDEQCDEPTDMCVVAVEDNLALIRTGDIHRFFIDIAARPESIQRYPHRKVHKAEPLPSLAPKLEAFRTWQAIYAEVLDLELVSVEKVEGKHGTVGKRSRQELSKLTQRMTIDIGSKAGVFEGLILYPARVGASLEIKIVEVSEKRCVGQVDAVVKDPGVMVKKGELVTTGQVKY